MESYHFSYYVVALIDLQGQSEKLEKFTTLPTSKEDREFEHFKNVVGLTFESVKRFRETILELREELTKKIEVPHTIKSKLNSSQLKLAEKYSAPVIDVQFFSDLALLKINLLVKEDHSPLVSIHSLFSQLAILMLTKIAEKVPLRGAIDVGICADLDENDLYGQAVSRAYWLEAEIADYPRMLIGPSLINYLNSFEDAQVSDEEKIIINSWLDYIGQCLNMDTDNIPILSYLAPVFLESYQYSKSEFEEIIKAASQFILNEIQRYEKSDDEKLKTRYIRLMNYFKNQNCWIEI